MTFDQLYRSLLKNTANGEPLPPTDPKLLDRLLHPENHAPVWSVQDCAGCNEDKPGCCAACLFGAIERAPDGKVTIDPQKCSGCAACLEACSSGALTASRDSLPALYDIKNAKGSVYALIAPSFLGQFSENVTPGRLRSAFMALGFTDMMEVALFADILTLKEALAYDENVDSIKDFQLTSCCCPVWISIIRKDYHKLIPHVPGAVSPMIAASRTIKALHPEALTVFIGPCLAKKSEAREPDLQGAVDWVLTYQEMRDIFQAADIHPEKMEDTKEAHSSRAGRIYGRAGGVSEAVYATAEMLRPERASKMKISRADGVQNCKAMLERLQKGEEKANYYEGMGCPGGCVGGPRAIVDREEGRKNVDRYGDEAQYSTPMDNPYVTDVLQRLGFDTVESFLAESRLYTRDFD